MENYKSEVEYYHDILLNKPEGQPGRNYLRKRGITRDTAIYWKLGYSPIGCTPDCYKDETFMFWNKLWGRLIIPVRTSTNKNQYETISGRLVEPVATREKNPKYDHYVFAARQVLFGLCENKGNIFLKNKAVITEGQLDVITAWQKGVKIICSSFGAHAGLGHFTVLNRYTENIYILYDNDDAGNEGSKNANKIGKENKINIKIKHPFPDGVDLDQWMKTHTKEDFYKIIDYDKDNYMNDKMRKMLKGQ